MDKPPNHRLFDTKGTALSPVLQHRLNLAASTSASLAPVINVTFVNEFANPFMTIQAPQIASASASLAPVINITFGNEFANPFKPIQAPQIAPTADVATLPGSSRSLIPFSRKPGNDMSISAFCTYYNLDDSIAMKFNSHSFKKARLLRYVTFTDLKDMEFKFGEIAALRDAVEKWSIPY